MSKALLIPSYEPKPRVADFLSTFDPSDFDYFLVVDDGSGEAYQEVFNLIKERSPFDVVSYPKNMGKGYALKYGLKILRERCPDIELVVTADSDSQHLRKDILAVKEAGSAHPDSLVLGVRNFKDAPPKSASGNLWSSRFFFVMTRQHIQDTQTGLRSIPACLFDLFLSTRGNRFDYEMNFLLDAARVVPIEQVEITTVYENGKNEGTHFRPIRDSLWVAKGLITYVLAFLLFIAMDIVLYANLASCFVPTQNDLASYVVSLLQLNAIALGVNGIFSYLILYFIAFRMKTPFWITILKYIGVLLGFYVFQTGISMISMVTGYPSIWLIVVSSILIAVAKIFVDNGFIFAIKKPRHHQD